MTALTIDYGAYLAGETCDTCFDVAWLLSDGRPSPVIVERMARNREALQRHLRNHDKALLARFTRAHYNDERRLP